MAGESDPRVAIVGATGAVGNQLIELLETRAFPRGRLRLFASPSGSAATLDTEERAFEVEPLTSVQELSNFDLCFLATSDAHAAEIVAAQPGPIPKERSCRPSRCSTSRIFTGAPETVRA